MNINIHDIQQIKLTKMETIKETGKKYRKLKIITKNYNDEKQQIEIYLFADNTSNLCILKTDKK